MTRYPQFVWLSDFLSPFEAIEESMRKFARQGVRGHLVHIVDPAEEDFPFAGRTRFEMGREHETLGRAENIGPAYRARFKAHAEAIAALARKLGWTMLTHRTDHRPELAPRCRRALRRSRGRAMSALANLSFRRAVDLCSALSHCPRSWFLLRVTPPSPRTVIFPPLRLLLGLPNTEETPAHMPLWLLLLRILTAALIILALAQPVIGESAKTVSSGPLVLFVDNGVRN